MTDEHIREALVCLSRAVLIEKQHEPHTGLHSSTPRLAKLRQAIDAAEQALRYRSTAPRQEPGEDGPLAGR